MSEFLPMLQCEFIEFVTLGRRRRTLTLMSLRHAQSNVVFGAGHDVSLFLHIIWRFLQADLSVMNTCN